MSVAFRGRSLSTVRIFVCAFIGWTAVCSTVCSSDYRHQCQPFTQFTTSCYKCLVFYTEASISLPNRQFTQEFPLCCWCRCQRRRVVNLTDFRYFQERRTMDIFLRQIAISCKSRTIRQRHLHIRRQELMRTAWSFVLCATCRNIVCSVKEGSTK